MATTKRVFSQTEIDMVWRKAKTIQSVDPNSMRQDYAGAWIRYSDYGNRNSQYGWEIDHIKPLALGGSDDLDNFLPLQWNNYIRKGDDYPRWSTEMTADGSNNIELEKYWKINL